MEDTNAILTKSYNGHDFTLLLTSPDGETWRAISRCDTCESHHHADIGEFNDSTMMFVDAELQLHANGVDDGWVDGPGIIIEDD